jgi:uncharacterized protein (TIGR03118 family)
MHKRLLASVASLFMVLIFGASAAAGGSSNEYEVHRLISDQPGHAKVTDSSLVNAWGISAGPSTPWWVANNGTNTSTLYDGTGAIVPLVVKVGGAPTGTVYNGSSDFVVTHGTDSGPSLFLFASEDGRLRGWNPAVPSTSPPSHRSFIVADRSGVHASYKGLAISSVSGANYLYATDFHNGRVDVFNGSFTLQNWAGAFQDSSIPTHFAPFGIQAINGWIFVTYAKQDADRGDEVDAPHLGYVDAYTSSGALIGRVASRDKLNAPWGIAWAPANFGRFSNDLLVGNFGDGRIHAYALTAMGWKLQGALRNVREVPVTIPGLWGIGFGNGTGSGPTNHLYFAAGPDDEAHGLFGSITVHN